MHNVDVLFLMFKTCMFDRLEYMEMSLNGGKIQKNCSRQSLANYSTFFILILEYISTFDRSFHYIYRE